MWPTLCKYVERAVKIYSTNLVIIVKCSLSSFKKVNMNLAHYIVVLAYYIMQLYYENIVVRTFEVNRCDVIIAFGWQTTPKRSWSGSRGQGYPFLISTSAIISPERLQHELPNFACRWNISSASLQMRDYPLIGVVMVTWPVFKILPLIIYSELVKLGTSIGAGSNLKLAVPENFFMCPHFS